MSPITPTPCQILTRHEAFIDLRYGGRGSFWCYSAIIGGKGHSRDLAALASYQLCKQSTCKIIIHSHSMQGLQSPVLALLLLLLCVAPALLLAGATRVETPIIHPEETVHVSLVNIFIKCDTEGATIRYTLDGSPPSPTSSALEADTTLTFESQGKHTIRAVASKEGLEDSEEAQREYEVHTRCEAPQLHPPGGTYEGTVSLSGSSGSGTSGAPDAAVQVCYTTDGSTPHSTATDGTRCVAAGQAWALSAAGETTVKAVAVRDGYWAKSTVTVGTYTVQAQVAAPVVLPAADTYILSAPLRISSGTTGAQVHYTLDGTPPTANSLAVTGATGSLVLSTTGQYTLRVRAFKEGMVASPETQRHITVQARMHKPYIEPLPSALGTTTNTASTVDGVLTYVGDLLVRLACSAEDGVGSGNSGVVFYSLDAHTTPTQASPFVACGANFTITAPAQVQVRAFAFENAHAYTNATNASHASTSLAPSDIVQKSLLLVRPPYDELRVQPSLNGYAAAALTHVRSVVLSPSAAPGSSYIDVGAVAGAGAGAWAASLRTVAAAGRLAVLENVVGHFGLALPTGGTCAEGGVLGRAVDTARAFAAPQEPTLTTFERNMLLAQSSATPAERSDWRSQYEAAPTGCSIAAPAGYFDVSSHACHGSVVSNGKLVHVAKNSAALTAVGFRNGSFVVGGVPEAELKSQEQPFSWLVSGSAWLVRGGTSYVHESLGLAVGDTDTTTTDFVAGQHARTVVGHDAEGRLLLLHVDGFGEGTGLSLADTAAWAVQLGFVSAVNLIGGVDSSLSHNGEEVSVAASQCSAASVSVTTAAAAAAAAAVAGGGSESYRCQPDVASVACAHSMAPPGHFDASLAPAAEPASESEVGGGNGNAGTSADTAPAAPSAAPTFSWASDDELRLPMPLPTLNATNTQGGTAATAAAVLRENLVFYQQSTMSLGALSALLLFGLAYSLNLNMQYQDKYGSGGRQRDSNGSGLAVLRGDRDSGVQMQMQFQQGPVPPSNGRSSTDQAYYLPSTVRKAAVASRLTAPQPQVQPASATTSYVSLSLGADGDSGDEDGRDDLNPFSSAHGPV